MFYSCTATPKNAGRGSWLVPADEMHSTDWLILHDITWPVFCQNIWSRLDNRSKSRSLRWRKSRLWCNYTVLDSDSDSTRFHSEDRRFYLENKTIIPVNTYIVNSLKMKKIIRYYNSFWFTNNNIEIGETNLMDRTRLMYMLMMNIYIYKFLLWMHNF